MAATPFSLTRHQLTYPNRRVKNGNTRFQNAVEKGSREEIKAWLMVPDLDVCLQKKEGGTVLHDLVSSLCWCYSNQTEGRDAYRERLLENWELFSSHPSFRIEANDKVGMTLLGRAAYYGSIEVASLLIQAGADPSAGTDDHRPLDVAYRAGKWDFIHWFMRQPGALTSISPSFLPRLMQDSYQVQPAYHYSNPPPRTLVEEALSIVLPLAPVEQQSMALCLQKALAANDFPLAYRLMKKGASLHEPGTGGDPSPFLQYVRTCTRRGLDLFDEWPPEMWEEALATIPRWASLPDASRTSWISVIGSLVAENDHPKARELIEVFTARGFALPSHDILPYSFSGWIGAGSETDDILHRLTRIATLPGFSWSSGCRDEETFLHVAAAKESSMKHLHCPVALFSHLHAMGAPLDTPCVVGNPDMDLGIKWRDVTPLAALLLGPRSDISIEIVRFFLERGANPNTIVTAARRYSSASTPLPKPQSLLSLSMERNRPDIFRLLLDFGANPSIPPSPDTSLIERALALPEPKPWLGLLFDLGIDPHTPTSTNRVPAIAAGWTDEDWIIQQWMLHRQKEVAEAVGQVSPTRPRPRM